jgi:lysophospholipase L1-like esterase
MPAASGGTGNLTISLHIPATTTVTSAAVHQDVNLLTSYAGGNDTTNGDGSPFAAANASTGDYYLAGVDATDTTTTDGTIAVLGDQTAVNAPAGTAAPGTWAADLPAALSNAGVNLPGGVANTSTGGSAPRPSAWWRLGEGNGATAHDAGTGLNNASLSGGYSWTSGATPAGTSSSLTLSGYSTNGYGVAATSGPVLDTSASFTVSTWVNLSSTTNNAIAVAQDGTNDSGFYLGYLAGNGGEWDFYFMTADTTTPAWQAQAAKTGATTGWTHLVGVYDASAKTARLYVNGALAATATGVTTWNATGPLTIGRDKYNGVLADYWPGQISDVRAWTSALTGTQVSAVYNDAGVSTLTSGNALTALQNTTVSEPNLRDVVISLGANDVLNGTSATTIENNLRALVTAVSGQYISDEPNAPVQPFVTTIAPLGLPTSDPREQVRTSVNTWIMNTYQGGQGIDIAASTANGGVADPANPNRIAPSLLTGTTPTAAYYTQIATDVASTIASAVPPIQLIVKLRGFH